MRGIASTEQTAPPPKAPAERPPVEHIEKRPEAFSFYEIDRARATAVGQSVKGYMAGYIADTEAKFLITAGDDGLPPLKLVKSDNGLDLALPSGKLVDYKFLGLRHFQIFGFRVVGMGF